VIGKTISHYKILEKLGEGGMGVVYKAQDIQLQRPVALKFLPPHVSDDAEEKARFMQEAQSASVLNHPNVTTIYGIEDSPNGIFIAMEYVEGETLKHMVEKEPLSVKKALDVGIQICEGLAMAHERGLVHRDIKSDNIMVTPRGQVKIMDFGLAKLKGAVRLTDTGSTLGTAAYMSPEQASGEEVDQRSDIFSFGVVLFELLTGKLPFRGEHAAAIVYSIMNEMPEPLAAYRANLPEGFQRMVDKALEKERDERYQHIDDLLADLRREKKSLEYEKTARMTARGTPAQVAGFAPAAPAAPARRKILPFVIPASVVFVAILLFLILKPFKLEIGQDKGPIAAENSLAVMYFENLVDREDKDRLGEIVTNLLITDLSESQYMNVVSSQRLYDILKLLGKEGTKVIDRDVASRVAVKAGAKYMLLGSILQIQPQVVLTSQLVEVESGRVVASERITGEPKENIFSMVDRLTVELKKGILPPTQAQKEKAPQVSEVTTHSPEAYRYFLQGREYAYKFYSKEAAKSFERALELDPTFAMAYYGLSQVAEDKDARRKCITKAVEYSDKVSDKEKHYIRAAEYRIRAVETGNREYYTQSIKELEKIVQRYPDEKEAYFRIGLSYSTYLQQSRESIPYFNKAIEIDPLLKLAYNSLAYAYNDIGDFDKSIWAINKYISLAEPDEPNPYDSRADLYAYNGRLDEAIQSYRMALKIKPDFYTSLMKLGHTYLFKREYARADSCYKEMASSGNKDLRSGGRFCLALIPLYQGRLREGLQVLDNGIAADEMEQGKGSPSEATLGKHWLKALIYEEKKDFGRTLAEIETGNLLCAKMYSEDVVRMRPLQAAVLAESGKVARAEEVLRVLKKDIEKKNKSQMHDYMTAVGGVELVKGNSKAAVTYLEKAMQQTEVPYFEARYLLVQAYLDAGKLAEAVAECEKLLLRYDDYRVNYPIWAVKAYYLMGLAYEKSGWNKKAVEKYQEFLEIWKNADPGIPEVADARQRLARLKGKA
jgi:tetratricopeptide (TPR) repeat protein/predicted Ser/Thr protein kinase